MNFRSDEWTALVKMLDERMEELDKLNRSPALDHDGTMALRGQFKALQWVKDWPNRTATMEGDDE